MLLLMYETGIVEAWPGISWNGGRGFGSTLSQWMRIVLSIT